MLGCVKNENEARTQKLPLPHANHVDRGVGGWETELCNHRSRGHYGYGVGFSRYEQESLYESGYKREQDVQRQYSLSKNGQRDRLLRLNLGERRGQSRAIQDILRNPENRADDRAMHRTH